MYLIYLTCCVAYGACTPTHTQGSAHVGSWGKLAMGWLRESQGFGGAVAAECSVL
jgi:hypothetical protein